MNLAIRLAAECVVGLVAAALVIAVAALSLNSLPFVYQNL